MTPTTTPTAPTRILGIDPSLTATALAGNGTSATITYPRGCDGDRRLLYLASYLREHLDIDRTELAILEDLPTHAQGAGKTGMAQGAVRTTLLAAGIPYVLITPASLKTLATGKGNAGKPDMRMELYRRTGLDLPDDNQVDAWWLREVGRQHHQHPDRLDLPQTHLRAMEKINASWAEVTR